MHKNEYEPKNGVARKGVNSNPDVILITCIFCYVTRAVCTVTYLFHYHLHWSAPRIYAWGNRGNLSSHRSSMYLGEEGGEGRGFVEREEGTHTYTGRAHEISAQSLTQV